MNLLSKATQPTIYFIGVTTKQSSIMKVFPQWAKVLGLNNVVIKGIDIEIHANPEVYREVVDFIKSDELSLGALVTTHKIDLFNASRDMFEYLDPYASMFGELSSISKKDGRLEGYAKDPISSGLALEAFLPDNFFREHAGDVLLLGAGGSAIAMSAYLLNKDKGDNIPSRLIVGNRSMPRLDAIARYVAKINPDVDSQFHLTAEPWQNDALVKSLKPYSLIVNATGLGKDRPGSPLTDAVDFPENSLVWEINYRGDLLFMRQALAQKERKNLHVEDGWIYFVHGWTQVIAEVFHIDISGELFDECERVANKIRSNG
ncbi:MAG: shikimate dehydrogenase [Clostridiaceae bacterium]|jgi:shikimate 5-dehydrogenase|nr:shikimate dehydrogenase [Clostridiaceae bacterium]